MDNLFCRSWRFIKVINKYDVMVDVRCINFGGKMLACHWLEVNIGVSFYNGVYGINGTWACL